MEKTLKVGAASLRHISRSLRNRKKSRNKSEEYLFGAVQVPSLKCFTHFRTQTDGGGAAIRICGSVEPESEKYFRLHNTDRNSRNPQRCLHLVTLKVLAALAADPHSWS